MNDDLNMWTYFEFERFAGVDYGYIRKRDHMQTLYFDDRGELMVNLNAEMSCTSEELAELENIAVMLLGGQDTFTRRLINPFGLVPRRSAVDTRN